MVAITYYILFALLGSLILALFLLYLKQSNWPISKRTKQHQEDSGKNLRVAMDSFERERQRIAEDIHNGMGALTQALRHTLYPLMKTADENDKREIISIVDQLTEKARTLSSELMLSSLERFGLMSALEEFCERSNKKVTLTTSGNALPIDLTQQILLYRIVQEGVNNAMQHAHAKNICVHLNWIDGQLAITISDDGIGLPFTPDTKFRSTAGLGLANIMNRAKLLKANFTVSKNIPNGTLLTIKMPIYVN